MKRVSHLGVILDVLIVSSGVSLIGWGIIACRESLGVGYWVDLALTLTGATFFILYIICALGLIFSVCPLKEGEVIPGTPEYVVYSAYVLLWANILHPLSRLLPPILSRPFYQLLGAKLGSNTYTAGVIFDPFFVVIGSNVLLGADSFLIPHVIEDDRNAHFPIRIGDDVTIGARAIVMAGCVIGNRAIVAMNSVVAKHTVIGDNEIWGGTPARLIKHR